jgi:hypothetical protein
MFKFIRTEDKRFTQKPSFKYDKLKCPVLQRFIRNESKEKNTNKDFYSSTPTRKPIIKTDRNSSGISKINELYFKKSEDLISTPRRVSEPLSFRQRSIDKLNISDSFKLVTCI